MTTGQPQGASTPNDDELAAAEVFKKAFQEAMKRPERLDEGWFQFFSLKCIVIAFIPWILAALIFVIVPDEAAENHISSEAAKAEISEGKSEPAQDDPVETGKDRFEQLGQDIEAVKQNLTENLTPATREAQEEKLAGLEKQLKEAKAAEIARVYAAQRADYLVVSVGIFSVFSLAAMCLYQTRIVQRHWRNLFPADHSSRVTRRPLVLASAVGIVALVIFIFGFPVILDLPSVLTVETNSTEHLLISLCAGFLTFLTFMTAFGAFTYRNNFPDAAVIAQAVKEAREVHAYKWDFREFILWALEGHPLPEKDKEVVEVMGAAQQILEPVYGTPTAPYLDNKLDAETSTKIIALLARVLGFAYILFIVFLALVISFLSAELVATEEVRTALNDLSKGWIIAVGTGFTLVLSYLYIAPSSGLSAFVTKAKPAPKLEIIGTKTGFVLTNPPKKKKAKDPKKELIDTLWKKHQNGLGAGTAKFNAIIASAHRGGGFHELLDASFMKHASTALGLVSPAIVASVLSFIA